MSHRSCPVCETETSNAGIGNYLDCRGCGVRFRKVYEGQQAQRLHDELYFSEGSRIEMTPQLLLEQYIEFVDEQCELAGADVVDFGCGIAPTGHLVSSHGAGSYVGVEFSAEARRQLQSEGLTTVATLGELTDRKFDVALMIEVIEHLPDPVSTLHELRDLLARDGRLFVVTPNAGGLKSRVQGDMWEQAALPAHVVLFDAGSLRRTLQMAGFEVVAKQRWIKHPGKSAFSTLGHRLLQSFGMDGGLRFLATPMPTETAQ